MKIKLLRLNCLRCRHGWAPRKPEVKMCPRCKTKYWNKTRTYDMKRKQRHLVKILLSMLDAAEFLRKVRDDYNRTS